MDNGRLGMLTLADHRGSRWMAEQMGQGESAEFTYFYRVMGTSVREPLHIMRRTT